MDFIRCWIAWRRLLKTCRASSKKLGAQWETVEIFSQECLVTYHDREVPVGWLVFKTMKNPLGERKIVIVQQPSPDRFNVSVSSELASAKLWVSEARPKHIVPEVGSFWEYRKSIW